MVGGLQRVGERTFAETRGNGEVAPKKPSTGRTPVLPLAHWGVASTKNSAEVAAAAKIGANRHLISVESGR